MQRLFEIAYVWWGGLFHPSWLWLPAAVLFPVWGAWCWITSGDMDMDWMSDARRDWYLRFGWISLPFVWVAILEHGAVSFAVFESCLTGLVLCLSASLGLAVVDGLARLSWRLR